MSVTTTATTQTQSIGEAYASIAGTVQLSATGATEEQVTQVANLALSDVHAVKPEQVSVQASPSSGRRLADAWQLSYTISMNREQHAAHQASFNVTLASAAFESRFSEQGLEVTVEDFAEPVVQVQVSLQLTQGTDEEPAEASSSTIAIVTGGSALCMVVAMVVVFCLRRHWRDAGKPNGADAGKLEEGGGNGETPVRVDWSIAGGVRVAAGAS